MSDLTPPSDHELLVQLRNGDDAAVEVLYPRYANRFYAAARTHLSHHDAEDAVQITFERMLSRIGTYRDTDGGGGSWLWQIHRRVVLDLLRRAPRLAEPLPDHELSGEASQIETNLDDEERYRCLDVAWDKCAAADQAEIKRGRGRGPGRKAWHEAVGRLRNLFMECYVGART